MLIALRFHSIATILIEDLQGIELHFGFSWPHFVLLFNLNQTENMISRDHFSVLREHMGLVCYMQVYMDVGCMRGNAKQLWNVPDDGSSVIEDGGEGKMAHREARVMRYKEKRQSRLFSKRIRYEVRKINAEKRPRLKVIYS